MMVLSLVLSDTTVMMSSIRPMFGIRVTYFGLTLKGMVEMTLMCLIQKRRCYSDFYEM